MNTKKNAIAAALISIFGVSQGVTAQTEGASPRGIEEIIVTAQKRSQNLQEVPISITALAGGDLQDKGVDNIVDLGQITPGLHVTRQVGASNFFVRGVGNNNGTPGNEPSVATFVDGVYLPNANANSFSFNNIERIEVLKGPQGTLFGRNATGGVIHIITKDPAHEPSLKARVGYGNYGTLESNIYGTLGLTDNLAADLAVYYRDQDRSPLKNPLPGRDHVPDNTISLRSKLLFTPNDDLSIKLSAFYDEFESSLGVVRQPIPGALATGGAGYSGDYYTLAVDYPTYHEVTSKGVSGQIDYTLNDVTFTSISSYINNEAFSFFDNDGSPNFVQDSIQPIEVDTFTQELRIASSGQSDLNWMLGLYFYDNTSEFSPGQYIVTPNFRILSQSKQDATSWAIFGETRWQVTESTGLTVGLRWNEDKVEHSGVTTFNDNQFPRYDQDETFEQLTYRVSLDNQINDKALVYAAVSRGYKSGVYNLTVTSPTPSPAIEPEILDAYEIGLKTDGWMDNRARINVAAFLYDYQDLQVLTVGAASQDAANAAEATIYGLEIEALAQVSNSLELSLGLAYLDSEYDQYLGVTNQPNADANGNPTGGNRSNIPYDFTGNDLYRAPEYTLSLGASYVLPTTVGIFSVDVNLYYNDGFYWDSENRLKEPSHELLNMQLDWSSISEKIKLGVWARNITDTEYSVFTNNSPSSSDAYTPGMPRTYGVYAEYHFH